MYLRAVVFLPMKHAHKYADNDPLMNQRFPNLPHSPSGTTTKQTVPSKLTSVSIGLMFSREEVTVTDQFPVSLDSAVNLDLTGSSFTAMAWVYSVAAVGNTGDTAIFGTYREQPNEGLHLVVSS